MAPHCALTNKGGGVRPIAVGQSFYSGQSFLRFGQYTLLSDEGPQLDHPLGPLLFCLTVMAHIKRIKFQCNIWFMDNGAMNYNVDLLLSDFRMLRDENRKLGLIVNVAKCEIITDNVEVLQKFRNVAPDIKHVKTASAMLLGAPNGGEQSVDDVLKAKLQELHRLSNRLSLFHAHDALFRLKNCFSISKLTNTLCSAHCYTRQLLMEYDDVIRSTLQHIMNVDLSDDVWNQATLTVANGGLGFRRSTDIAQPAYLSVTGSHALITQLLQKRLHAMSGTDDPTFTAAVADW
jgi:hypothetical protein